MATNAAIAVIDHYGISPATGAAFEQAREQIGRTPQALRAAGLRRLLDRRIMLGQRPLLALDRLPQIIADDAEVRHFIPQPFGFGIAAHDLLAGAREIGRANV